MRRALITGAGQGIGAATARALAAVGLDVVVSDIDAAAAESVAKEIGATAMTMDVADTADVSRVAAAVGHLDILVNNAGIWHKHSLADSTEAQLRSVLDVNVGGTITCTKAFAPLLRGGDRPCVVNLSSGAAVSSSPNLGSYPASKAAVESLTRQWALELAPIRVNVVGPGMIVTEGTAVNYEGDAAAMRARAVPLGRIGRPDDVADVITFLVGDRARYVSGQVLYVDGGISAGVMGR